MLKLFPTSQLRAEGAFRPSLAERIRMDTVDALTLAQSRKSELEQQRAALSAEIDDLTRVISALTPASVAMDSTILTLTPNEIFPELG